MYCLLRKMLFLPNHKGSLFKVNHRPVNYYWWIPPILAGQCHVQGYTLSKPQNLLLQETGIKQVAFLLSDPPFITI